MMQTHLYYYDQKGFYGMAHYEPDTQLAKGLTRISLKEYRANRIPARTLPAMFMDKRAVKQPVLSPRQIQEQQRQLRLWKAFKWA